MDPFSPSSLKRPQVNFFAKPIDGLINKSTLGGILTLLSFLISFFLLLSELYQFALIDTHEHLQIRKIPDTKESVAIKLHITFPYLHCNDLQVDYVNTKSDEKLDRRQVSRNNLERNYDQQTLQCQP